MLPENCIPTHPGSILNWEHLAGLVRRTQWLNTLVELSDAHQLAIQLALKWTPIFMSHG